MTPTVVSGGAAVLAAVLGLVWLFVNRKSIAQKITDGGPMEAEGDELDIHSKLRKVIEEITSGAALSLPSRQIVCAQLVLLDAIADKLPNTADRKAAHDHCAALLAVYGTKPRPADGQTVA